MWSVMNLVLGMLLMILNQSGRKSYIFLDKTIYDYTILQLWIEIFL